MRKLVIHDNVGTILSIKSGTNIKEPVGVPFVWIDVPEGKMIQNIDGGIGVDVTKTPHEVFLVDIPPSEIELVRLEMARNNAELFETMIMLTGGM